MQKTCRICGKAFEPRHRNHVLCSAECRKINNRLHQRKWVSENKEHWLELSRNKPSYKARLKPHYCTICGKLIERYANMHQIRHDECVLQAIVDSLNGGNPLTHKQYQQLQCRGYTIEEFYMEYADILNYEEKEE